MKAQSENQVLSFSRALSEKLPAEDAQNWVRQYAQEYRELLSCYHCAMMEVETKFKVLNENFIINDNSNPIQTIKTRIKAPDSIIRKLADDGEPLTIESMEKNLNDIAGIRVICSFQSDIYMLADALLTQDDVFLLSRKDYIKNPKPNGYRSLHLVIAVPIFLHKEKKLVKVEVQLRTLAMDVWASLEHKIRYKNPNLSEEVSMQIKEKLLDCANMSARLDSQMEQIWQQSKGEEIDNAL